MYESPTCYVCQRLVDRELVRLSADIWSLYEDQSVQLQYSACFFMPMPVQCSAYIFHPTLAATIRAQNRLVVETFSTIITVRFSIHNAVFHIQCPRMKAACSAVMLIFVLKNQTPYGPIRSSCPFPCMPVSLMQVLVYTLHIVLCQFSVVFEFLV